MVRRDRAQPLVPVRAAAAEALARTAPPGQWAISAVTAEMAQHPPGSVPSVSQESSEVVAEAEPTQLRVAEALAAEEMVVRHRRDLDQLAQMEPEAAVGAEEILRPRERWVEPEETGS